MSQFDLDVEETEIAEIDKRLKQLSETLQTRAIRAGLRSAGKPVAARAKQLAPFDSSHSEDHLRQGISTSLYGNKLVKRLQLYTDANQKISLNNPGQVMVIGPNRKVKGRHQMWKGSLIEFGTSKGSRTIRKGKLKGARYLTRGIRPRPFMAPAFASGSSGLNHRFYQGLQHYLDRI